MKYKLTQNTKALGSKTLYQIQAEEYFSDVKKGDLGGWIEKKFNLSQFGSSWVYDNAIVYGNAKVYGNAIVSDNARISGYAVVYDNAIVNGNAIVSGNAWVYDDAQVHGGAQVYGGTQVRGSTKVCNILCSRFVFTSSFQIEKWHELEKQFEDFCNGL